MLRRILAAVVVVVMGLVLLVLAWPQLFGLEHTLGIAQIVALRGAAALTAVTASLLLGACALGIRSFRRLGASLIVVLLLFVGINAAVIGSRGLGGSTVDAASESTPEGAVTVMAWNTLGGAASPEMVADLALTEGADVVALPETTEQFAVEVAALMKAADRPMWVHAVSFDDDFRAKQTALLTSVDLGEYAVDRSAGNTGVLPTVIARPVDKSGPTLVAAHPVAPIPGFMQQWPEDLRFLAQLCTGDVIIAGDFNSTIDHWSGLADAEGADLGGCTDAARSAGAAAVGTWPSALPALLGSPIDHVVATSQWTATSFRVATEFDGSGSDHRPIVATLIPSG